MICARLRGAHAEPAQVRAAVLVAPGDVDVVFRTVEHGNGPDVAVVEKGGAVDALEL